MCNMRKILKKGALITFEGGEGSGKSTQITLLRRYLSSRGYSAVVTREPGRTPVGRRIRRILLDPRVRGMAPMTELLLYLANRAQHVEEVIGPGVREGRIVLCDRFSDSTTAYQVGARGLDASWVKSLDGAVTAGLRPSLTILLDCPPEIGLRRVRRENFGRLEREGLLFHRRVRRAYLDQARREPGRIKVVDARGDLTAVQGRVRGFVDAFLHRRHAGDRARGGASVG